MWWHKQPLPNPFAEIIPDQNGAAKTLAYAFHHFLKFIEHQESQMADFTKLMSDIADLSAKVDQLLAKEPPADEQPAVDQAAAAVEAISAKIPTPAA